MPLSFREAGFCIVVGRTPWSARDALVPLFAWGLRRLQPSASRPGGRLRTRGSAHLGARTILIRPFSITRFFFSRPIGSVRTNLVRRPLRTRPCRIWRRNRDSGDILNRYARHPPVPHRRDPHSRKTFTVQTSGTTASLRGVWAVSDQIVWASGSRGTYLRTTDGGAHWTAATVPDAAALGFSATCKGSTPTRRTC